MALDLIIEKCSGTIHTVTIGATAGEGGSRASVIKVGGQGALPFLFAEGEIPHKPVIAYEVWDESPVDWPDELVKAYGDSLKDPFKWMDKCINEFKAKLLCIKLSGANQENLSKSAKEAAGFIKEVLKKTSLPLIIIGSGDDARDNEMLPAVSEAAKGERCLIGSVVQDNYKTLTAAVLADGHSLIAESPIDINIAKQLNILISDMGLGLDRIVINPTIGALGYGLEYAYSIMERSRLAGLAGDKSVASPFICFVGQESWKVKEVRSTFAEKPSWGNQKERGIAWEAVTASSLLQAGADILVMRHPEAIKKVEQHIDNLFKNQPKAV